MIDTTKLSEEERKVIEARRAYKKKWREKNRDKVKQHNEKFYKKLANSMQKNNASC